MSQIDFGAALRRARGASPAGVGEILADTALRLGAADVVLYLVDFGQTMLEPLPDLAAHAEVARAEEVAGTMAGRAFIDQQVVTAERDEGMRVWIPVVEGSDRTGVLALTLPEADEQLVLACEELGLLAGYLIAAQARCTDVFNLYRRRHSMSLAASMQWDLLPPLVLKTGPVTVAGLVEPAYEVGGDCFDYAANGSIFEVAIMDAMGHGLKSAVLAQLATGVYRHDRREARPLVTMHQSLATTLRSLYQDGSFVSGLLARIETATGVLTWTNAGHPPPLLIRGGQVIRELSCPPTLPWGLVDEAVEPTVATDSLEPGDSLLLYTDGVTDVRTADGEFLGIDRLVDLTQRSVSALLRPEEIVRQLTRAVLSHRGADLVDDATIVLIQWEGPAEIGGSGRAG